MKFRQELYEILVSQDSLSWQEILLNLGFACLIGVLIFVCYAFSHRGTIYSKKFNVSLVVLTLLTAMALTVIGNNMAMSLGMVGALSIVRFRTAIKDSRDTVFIFWAVIGGICCGAGDYLVASIGSALAFLILSLFGAIKNDDRLLIIIRAGRSEDGKIQSLMFRRFHRRATLRVHNTDADSTELIYEVSRRQMKKAERKNRDLTEEVYKIGHIEYFNIVMQNDEVSS